MSLTVSAQHLQLAFMDLVISCLRASAMTMAIDSRIHRYESPRVNQTGSLLAQPPYGYG